MDSNIDIVLNKKFVDDIDKYKVAMISKNMENIEFMSSYLVGVHTIRFTDNDKENMFLYLGIDVNRLRNEIRTINGLDPSWKVSTDPFNLSLIWVMHKAINSNLPNNLKHQLITDLGIILQFKMLTSLYFHYFKYPVNKDLAQLVYEKLPRSVLIKRLGTNYAVLEYRSQFTYENKTLSPKLKKGSAKDINYLLSDLSGSLRSMLKVYYSTLLEVKESKESKSTISIVTTDEDDGDTIRDINDAHREYFDIIKNKLYDRNMFINNELLQLLEELFPKADMGKVKESLQFIFDQNSTNGKDILDLVNKIVEVNIGYLYVNKELYPPYVERLVLITKYLKGLWSSSNAKDKRMREAKDVLVNLVQEATSNRTKHVLLSVAIIVAIYIFMLAITKHRY